MKSSRHGLLLLSLLATLGCSESFDPPGALRSAADPVTARSLGAIPSQTNALYASERPSAAFLAAARQPADPYNAVPQDIPASDHGSRAVDYLPADMESPYAPWQDALLSAAFGPYRPNSLGGALAVGDLQQLKAFVAEGRTIDEPVGPRDYDWLSLAALAGHQHIVDFLLQQGADVNAKTLEGWTPVIQAATAGHLGIVRRLAAQGADLGYQTDVGISALQAAVRRGHVDILAYLLDHGIDVEYKIRFNAKSWESPLTVAAAAGRAEVVRELLHRGADVNAANSASQRPLYLAVRRFTIVRGCCTPLLRQTLNNELAVIELLVSGGADVAFANQRGESLMAMLAAKFRIALAEPGLNAVYRPYYTKIHELLVPAQAMAGHR